MASRRTSGTSSTRGKESGSPGFSGLTRRAAVRTNSTEGFPSPDLAIEIDISPPKVDRPGIYAALGVAELWRFDGDVAVIERLMPGGRYEPIEKSQWLEITPADVVRWLVQEDTAEFIPWLNRVTKWARRKFAGRRP